MTDQLAPTGQELAALDQIVVDLGLNKPTAEQARVAIYPTHVGREGEKLPTPLLVVAGAGSGKTETLSLRATFVAAYYGVEPDAILGLTFTRKAAGELEQRLRDRLNQLHGTSQLRGAGPSPSELMLTSGPEATTYNAFALSIVREFGPLIGLDPQVEHIGTAASWELMSEIVEAWERPLAEGLSPSTTIDCAISLRQEIANQGMTVEDARRRLRQLEHRFEEFRAETGGKPPFGKFHKDGLVAVKKRQDLLDIVEVFDARLRELGRMDYADQVGAATRIVKEVPEAREALRQRHQVVFLDEFQDTSVAQMELFSTLFKDHPVTAVGDPNQAIYGWRGASAASLEDFHPLFNTDHRVDNQVLTLSTAWRNDELILEVANTIAAPLAKVPSWTPRIPGTMAAGSESPGLLEVGGDVSIKELSARQGAGRGRVEGSYRRFASDSASDLVDFVRRARVELVFGKDRPVSVAVLSRVAAPLVEAVEALREAGIPAQLASGDALLKHPAVADLRAALEITSDIGRSSQLMRLLANLDLGASDLRALGSYASRLRRSGPTSDHGSGREALLTEAVEAIFEGGYSPGLSKTGTARISQLGGKLKRIRSMQDASIVDQIEVARSVMGTEMEALADPTSVGVSDTLDQFVQMAADYQSSTEQASLPAFLAWLCAVESKEQGLRIPSLDVDPNAVQAMTIHGSKGLEWDAVAIIGMERGRFPSYRGGDKDPKRGPFMPDGGPPAPQGGWWTNVGLLPYPHREDRSHLPPLEVWDSSMRVSAIESSFKEDIGDHLNREERRLAYVAMTRARQWLYLGGSWWTGRKRVRPPSMFLTEAAEVPGVVCRLEPSPTAEEIEKIQSTRDATMFPAAPGEVRLRSEQVASRVMEEMRDLEGRNSSDIVAEVIAGIEDRELARDVEALLNEHRRRHESSRYSADALTIEGAIEQIAQQRPVAVTELAYFDSRPDQALKDLLRPVPAAPATTTLVGTAFHAWIELHLKQFAAASVEQETADDISELQVALSETDQEFLESLKTALLKSDVLTDRSVEGLEVPFTYSADGLTVRGRVDAVFKGADDALWLIDWKTRRSLPDSLSEADLRYYRTQLSQYELAWQAQMARQTQEVTNRQTSSSSSRAELVPALVFIAPEGVRLMKLEEIERLLDVT